MRLSRALTAALLVGASAALAHADDSDIPWYQRLFGASPPKQQVRAQKPPANIPPSKEKIEALIRDEEMRHLERLNYCTRLRTIAMSDPNHIDQALLDQVDKIETTANEVFTLKTNKLKARHDQAVMAEESRPDPAVSRTAGIAQPQAVKRAPNGRPIVNKDPEGNNQ